ncbi:MAG: septum site-determining protein MinC [Anaerolineae bacterium]|nr:septum site-determining protein MinC [Anaerolineae bacterium]
MQEQAFAIKGVRDGLLISLDPTAEWGAAVASLAARIDEQSHFFAGARIIVDVGERPVPKYELTSLKALLERRGLTLWAVLSASETTADSADALDLRTSVGGIVPAQGEREEEAGIDPEEIGTAGVMIRRTLRSGRTVHSSGHVMVYGDVNPGAEIIATGDVVVWGRLRGNVHAGAEGDEDAVVCALDMTPTQLRIAGYIVTSPPEKRRKPRPEVALVRDGQIVVEAW